MRQKMLVNVQEDETRIALIENQRLVDLHVEVTNRERTVGNIYRGVIVKVNPAFQAAFVEYGEKKNGFLSISDINPKLFNSANEQRSKNKIQTVLKGGQTVMVQVMKEGVGDKGAALTTFISLPGRYMVLTPNSDRSGVSRKIEDSDKRGPLKDLLTGLVGDSNIGVIIRTAGIDRSAVDLKRDLANLKKEWKGIESKNDDLKKPGLLYREPGSIIRVLRDYFSEDVEEVWVDSAEAFSEALNYLKATLPKFQKRLKLFVGDQSLFSHHKIEQQIEALDSSKVFLKSGGSIIIESTEALVSIDVNSGKSNQSQDIESTALNTNLEAAEEASRQLRLRNLGGLIVLDFIDMVAHKNREQVKNAMEEALKNDKARTTLGEISQFGMMEMSRQRIDVELSRGTRIQCENCGGTGFVPTINSSSNNVLRKIRELAATGNYSEIHGVLPLENSNFLLNLRRENLRDLELEFDIHIHLTGDASLPSGHPIHLTGTKHGQEKVADSSLQAGTPPEISPQKTEDSSSRPRHRGRKGRGRSEGGESSAPQQQAPQQQAPQQQAPQQQAPQQHQEEKSREAKDVRPSGKKEPEKGRKDAAEPVERTEVKTSPSPTPQKAPQKAGKIESMSKKTLVIEKRGGWIGSLGNNATTGDTLFQSSHKPTKKSDLPIILPSRKRSVIFKEVPDGDNKTLFTSQHATGKGATKRGSQPVKPGDKDSAKSRARKGTPKKTSPQKEGKPAAKSTGKASTPSKKTGKTQAAASKEKTTKTKTTKAKTTKSANAKSQAAPKTATKAKTKPAPKSKGAGSKPSQTGKDKTKKG